MEIMKHDDFFALFDRRFAVNAPYYLAIFFEETEENYYQVGYLGEQIVLMLTKMGIGTCWLGGPQPKRNAGFDLPFAIAISFGMPAEPFRKEENLTSIKRKALAELMIEGEPNPAIEAARLAPSAVNFQPVRYATEGENIHVYRVNSLLKSKHLTAMQKIDAGIAIAHIMEEDKNYHFERLDEVPIHEKGLIYIGSVLKE
jgi:hypothetical protein